MRYPCGNGLLRRSGGAIDTVLIPAFPAPSGDARTLFRAGYYRDALAIATRDARAGDERAALLTARIHLRISDPAVVIEVLKSAPTTMSTHEHRVEAAMILATAHARKGEHGAAAPLMANVDVPAALAGEWNVLRANHAWIRGDDVATRQILAATSDEGDPWLRLRIAELRGWIAARAERLTEQAVILRVAFDEYAEAGYPDVGLAAWSLRTLAALNAEISIKDLDDTVRLAVASVPWTADLSAERFQVMHYLATSETLRGSWFTALRFAREAHKIAPTAAWKVSTLVDLAWVRGTLGEVRGAAADLYEALDLIAQVDWDGTNDDERWALIEAAEVCADSDPKRAQSLLHKAQALMASAPAAMISRSDVRTAARIDQSAGVIFAALGQDDAAERAFRKAYEIYDRIGYSWRAGMMAYRLYECSGRRRWLEDAQRRFAPYPDSWMAKKLAIVATKAADPVFRTLTKRPREVCLLLCDGFRAAEIAETLAISIATTRCHIRAVYQAYGVRSQPELIRRRGGRTQNSSKKD